MFPKALIHKQTKEAEMEIHWGSSLIGFCTPFLLVAGFIFLNLFCKKIEKQKEFNKFSKKFINNYRIRGDNVELLANNQVLAIIPKDANIYLVESDLIPTPCGLALKIVFEFDNKISDFFIVGDNLANKLRSSEEIFK